MTEHEWVTSADPRAMLTAISPYSENRSIRIPVSDRKLRLFACACCRANGTKAEVISTYETNGPPDIEDAEHHTDEEWARGWCDLTAKVSQKTKADFLRCLFGNPWRPPSCGWEEDVWRGDWCLTKDVLGIARTIYDENRWGEVAVLADALEEAGCDDVNLLQHLRGPGPHARGCHVLDLLLGK